MLRQEFIPLGIITRRRKVVALLLLALGCVAVIYCLKQIERKEDKINTRVTVSSLLVNLKFIYNIWKQIKMSVRKTLIVTFNKIEIERMRLIWSNCKCLCNFCEPRRSSYFCKGHQMNQIYRDFFGGGGGGHHQQVCSSKYLSHAPAL